MRSITIRRIAQAACLLFFLYLLVSTELTSDFDRLFAVDSETNAALRTDLPVNLFLRLSPLVGLTTSLSSRTLVAVFWPSFLMVVATLLAGRFFCGWVCPLGTTIDMSDTLLKEVRHTRNPPARDNRRFKYCFLIFLAVLSLLGIQVAGWFDPLSLAFRSYALTLHAYLTWVETWLAWLVMTVDWLRPFAAPVHGFLKDSVLSFNPVTYSWHVLILILFVGILALGVVQRRYWCRNLCPLGALLGLLSFRPFVRRTAAACISCGRCVAICKGGAVADGGRKTLQTECIECLSCKEHCPTGSVAFLRRDETSFQYVDMSRRSFMRSLLGAGVFFGLFTVDRNNRTFGRHTIPIRPPGASAEPAFLDLCIRCGECMKVCPGNVLHPALFETGVEGLWTPVLQPRIGYCHFTCTLCSETCPSRAIQKIALPDKQKRCIGLAWIDKPRCIPWARWEEWKEGAAVWSDAFNCAVCEEVCPTHVKAIRFDTLVIDEQKGWEIRRPVVVREECIGCGFCEYVCPVKGVSAIRIRGVAQG